jgi:hypothetical protein
MDWDVFTHTGGARGSTGMAVIISHTGVEKLGDHSPTLN